MRTIIPAILLVTTTTVHSQTFSEWFRQNKTQLKYLVLQIEALQANAATTEHGYQIAETGTQSISSVSQADLDLHRSYFQSLTTVNPALRQLIAPILQCFNRITAITRGYSHQLQIAATEQLDWLHVLTTDGAIQMRDDQRLTAIQNISQSMQQILTDAIITKNQLDKP